MQRDPKDKDSEFDALLQGLKDLVCTRLQGKVLSASSPIAIYRALICLNKPLRKTKKCALIMSFNMIRHPRGENSISWLFHLPLIIPRVSVNLAKMKCGRVLAKDFTILRDFQTKSYDRKSFLTNASNDGFRWEKV